MKRNVMLTLSLVLLFAVLACPALAVPLAVVTLPPDTVDSGMTLPVEDPAPALPAVTADPVPDPPPVVPTVAPVVPTVAPVVPTATLPTDSPVAPSPSMPVVTAPPGITLPEDNTVDAQTIALLTSIDTTLTYIFAFGVLFVCVCIGKLVYSFFNSFF